MDLMLSGVDSCGEKGCFMLSGVGSCGGRGYGDVWGLVFFIFFSAFHSFETLKEYTVKKNKAVP